MTNQHETVSAELIRQHADGMRRLALRLVGSEQDAQDLVQDASIIALERGHTARRPRAWLMGIVRILALRKQRARATDLRHRERLVGFEAHPSSDEVAEQLELQRRVANLLAELEEPYRTTLHMRFFAGLSVQEMASRRTMPASTIKSQIARGLARLRARLDRAHVGSRQRWSTVLLANLDHYARASTAGGSRLTLAFRSLVMSSKLELAATGLVIALLVSVGSFAVSSIFSSDGESGEVLSDTEGLEQADAAEGVETVSGPQLQGAGVADQPASSSALAGEAAERSGESGMQDQREAPLSAKSSELGISGQVLDPEGQPVSGVRVEIFSNYYRTRKKPQLLAQTLSDQAGRFSLRLLQPQSRALPEVVVAARSDLWGQLALEHQFKTERESSGLTLQFLESAWVDVTVEDDEGRGLAEVECLVCFASGVPYRLADGSFLSVRTDTSGCGRIQVAQGAAQSRFNLASGPSLRVLARKDGFVPSHSNVVRIKAGESAGTKITLGPARSLVCWLQTEDGEPLAKRRFRLDAEQEGDAGGPAILAVPEALETDEEGRIVLKDVPLGRSWLHCSSPGMKSKSVLAEAGESELVIEMSLSYQARFLFVDEETQEPLEIQLVRVRPVSEGPLAALGPSQSGRTRLKHGSKGQVTVFDLQPGRYEARILFAGRQSRVRHLFMVEDPEAERQRVSIRAAEGPSLKLRVTDSRGKPAAGVACWLGPVSAFNLDSNPPYSVVSCTNSTTSAQGLAKIEGLRPGEYAVLAISPDGRLQLQRVTVSEGSGDEMSLAIKLEEGGRLSLPLPSFFESNPGQFCPQVRSSEGRRFFPKGKGGSHELSDCPPGEVTCIPESRHFETLPFKADPYALSLDLQASGEAKIRWPQLDYVTADLFAYDSESAPITDRRVLLLRTAPDTSREQVKRYSFKGGKSLRLNREGKLEDLLLLPGHYFLVFIGPDTSAHSFEVGLAKSQTVTVRR